MLRLSNDKLAYLRDRGVIPFTKLGAITYYSLKEIEELLQSDKLHDPKRKAKRFQPLPKKEKQPIRSNKQGFGREMPPDYMLVEIYFDQKEAPLQVAPFFRWYESINWTGPRGATYKNWKVLASNWIFNYHQQLKLQKRLKSNNL